MSVPRYQDFIEPVLRCLATENSPVDSSVVHEAAALSLDLDESELAMRTGSGVLIYKNRAGWAFNALKHAGLGIARRPGAWELTEEGREFAKENPRLTEEAAKELANVASRSREGSESGTQKRRVPTVRHSTGDRKAYRLPAQPLAAGGQAEVYEAVRKCDGQVFALKRIRGGSPNQRMRREIEVQRSLGHPNVMPIVDWDSSGFGWYVMPRGDRTMGELERPIPQRALLEIVDSVAAALEAAHAAGYPHRDVKPANIIELSGSNQSTRWVLADWGLTRRPLGETTTGLTRSEQMLGTVEFAPPEAYREAHLVGEPGDIFSLGQVISWAVGCSPIPNEPGTAPEPWRALVEDMTKLSIAERSQSMRAVREALSAIRKCH